MRFKEHSYEEHEKLHIDHSAKFNCHGKILPRPILKISNWCDYCETFCFLLLSGMSFAGKTPNRTLFHFTNLLHLVQTEISKEIELRYLP